jgi:hypothetical protein
MDVVVVKSTATFLSNWAESTILAWPLRVIEYRVLGCPKSMPRNAEKERMEFRRSAQRIIIAGGIAR